jgi:hypothetical protein
MLPLLNYLDILETDVNVDTTCIINNIDNYISHNKNFIPHYFNDNEEYSIYNIYRNYSVKVLKILSKIIAFNKHINKYNFYKFFLVNIISYVDSQSILKYAEILSYCIVNNFFPSKIINKFIYYYSTDIIWDTVREHIPSYHYIYKGMTILNLSLHNIPLFDFLLTDAIEKKLYDDKANKYVYYTDNHLLTRNLDYEISIYMSKSNSFRTYILSKLPLKYRFLKNYRRLQNIIVKNNIHALEEYFEKYSKFLTPNSRLNCNQPLLDYVETIEMFYYIIKRGANINALTTEPTIFSEIRYNEFYYTNTLYNNPLFVLNNLDHYYKAGLDFSVNKKVLRKLIKIHFKLFVFNEPASLYLYDKLLSLSNKYINKTKNKVKILLKNKFYRDIVTKINEFI